MEGNLGSSFPDVYFRTIFLRERKNCHGPEPEWNRWISCENIYTKKFSAVAFFSVWNEKEVGSTCRNYQL